MREHHLIATCVVTAAVLLAGSAGVLAEQGTVPVQEPEAGRGEKVHSSYAHQSAIENFSDKSLGELAREQSPVQEDALAYGFAAKSEEAKFFIIGSLYSETLAHLSSGQAVLAAERLAAIEREFITLKVPRSLYNYVSKMRNMIASGKYEPGLNAELLSLFQPFFEDYARGQSEDKLTLFRAGTWLLDMSLTAAAGDLELLHQEETLAHFTGEMRRMDAPQGVMRALEEITAIVKQEKVSERDVRSILRLVKRIQTILG
jgi:hypothetical protein